MTAVSALCAFDPATFRRHALHGEEAAWPEKNCYADLWIAVLHHLGLQPRALGGMGLGVDCEGDQFTFFKPSAGDLWDLYGIDVQEMTVWRPLLDHALEQLDAGRLLSVEVDAWWLPDTAATDYRRQHTKTTVLMVAIDTEAQRLVYFHNSGCYALDGEDFRGVFALDAPADAARLPLFAELVKIERRVARADAELARIALPQLQRHRARAPQVNPYRRFAQRIDSDMASLRDQGLDRYHLWAFAAIRQAGAASELAADHLRWMDEHLGIGVRDAGACFDTIAQTMKALIMKGARSIVGRRTMDATALLEQAAAEWDRGMAILDASGLTPPASS